MSDRPNPFTKRVKQTKLKKFKGKKRMLSTTDGARKGRACKFRKGMKVRLSWQQYPSLGGKRKFMVGTVTAVEWSNSGATVVISDKENVTMRHSLFAPGNSKMKVVS